MNEVWLLTPPTVGVGACMLPCQVPLGCLGGEPVLCVPGRPVPQLPGLHPNSGAYTRADDVQPPASRAICVFSRHSDSAKDVDEP